MRWEFPVDSKDLGEADGKMTTRSHANKDSIVELIGSNVPAKAADQQCCPGLATRRHETESGV